MSNYGDERVDKWVKYWENDKPYTRDWPKEWQGLHNDIEIVCHDDPIVNILNFKDGTHILCFEETKNFAVDIVLTTPQIAYLKLTNGKNWQMVVPEVPVK